MSLTDQPEDGSPQQRKRTERVAAALRANLRRRKEQQQQREITQPAETLPPAATPEPSPVTSA